MLPRWEGVKGGAILGVLRQIGRDHMYDDITKYIIGYPKMNYGYPKMNYGYQNELRISKNQE